MRLGAEILVDRVEFSNLLGWTAATKDFRGKLVMVEAQSEVNKDVNERFQIVGDLVWLLGEAK